MSGPRPPALVILAAGASTRLGRCKAQVPLGPPGAPRTPLELLLAAGAVCDAEPPLVVTGADHDAIRVAAPPGAELLFNPRWAAGRTGGVALAAERRPGRDLLLAPVDVPLVPAEVFEALVRAWLAAGAPGRGWLAPTVAEDPDGRRGHPIVLGRELVAGARGLGADEPLRRLRADAAPLWSIPVPSAAIFDDLDTPEDLSALRARFRRD